MRTIAVTPLLIVLMIGGSAAGSAAQQSPATPSDTTWILSRRRRSDAGNVAASVGDLNLDKTSFGAGLRVHSRASTLARLDVAHSREGWQVFLKLSDPFRLARRTLRASVVPFVP